MIVILAGAWFSMTIFPMILLGFVTIFQPSYTKLGKGKKTPKFKLFSNWPLHPGGFGSNLNQFSSKLKCNFHKLGPSGPSWS